MEINTGYEKVPSKINSFIKKNRFSINMTVMALPGILFFLIFSYLPMVGIIIAFKNYNFKDGILFSPWIGLKNFEFFFASNSASRITFNTLFLNALFIITGTVFQVGLAIILNELKNRRIAKVSNTVMFLPYFISWVIVGYFTYALLNYDYGLINKTLESFGLQGIDWYNTPAVWPAILVICNIWKSCGYGSIIYTAGIMGINSEYYEAAIVDGAKKRQQITKITIPLLKPMIIILTLLSVGRIFYADFGMFYNVTQNSGLLYSTTDVMDTYVYRAIRVTGDFGMASAAGFIQSIVGFLLVLLSNYAVKKIDDDYKLF
jgi:ABC-type polysaccharide transport system, permease component